jgi:hypothetical protein
MFRLYYHSTIIIFNAIIWHYIYFDFIEDGVRRKEKGERGHREKGKKKNGERNCAPKISLDQSSGVTGNSPS